MPAKTQSIAKITRPRLCEVYARTRLFRQLDALRSSPAIWIAGPPGAGNAGNFNDLLEDYASLATSATDRGIRLTISDLDPSGSYKLILYGVQNALGGRGSTFDIGDDIRTTDGNITTIFSAGNTHVTYAGLTPNGSGEIVVDITKTMVTLSCSTAGSLYRYQFQRLSGSSVPDCWA
jgi:hypothetical protein